MRSRDTSENDLSSALLKRWLGKPNRVVCILTMSLLPVGAYAADGPQPSLPGGERHLNPDTIPENKIEPDKVPNPPSKVPPSKIDPGIQHTPDTLGDPRGAVKPPIIDPGISKNPEAAPPGNKESNPPGKESPQRKPDVR